MAASSGAEQYPSTAPSPRVVVVVSGWPRISETFAQHELHALAGAGALAGIVATKPGDTTLVQPGLDTLAPLVTVLPDGDATTQAAALAEHVRRLDGVEAIHGYFAHRPAEIAAIAAEQLGLPFGFSVHALDLRKVESSALRARAAAAAVVVTCNRDAHQALAAAGVDARLVAHGVDVDRFSPGPTSPHLDPVRLLAVGRLVEKKGFATLIDAVRLLGDVPIELVIVGDGPDRAALTDRITCGGLTDRVRLAGRTTHDELPEWYRGADIVVIPSVVDRAGDRDGLPNVVLEAMASGCAIVASDVAAIASAIADRDGDEANGVLVAPGDAVALAAAIGSLADDPMRRHRLGANARRTAEERFELHACSARFCHEIAAAYGATTPVGSRP
jgi:glycosyltransferase involved in cell wall biosynthesis